jgi:hypothetical protein
MSLPTLECIFVTSLIRDYGQFTTMSLIIHSTLFKCRVVKVMIKKVKVALKVKLLGLAFLLWIIHKNVERCPLCMWP